MKTFILVLLILTNNGEFRKAEAEAPSIQECVKAGTLFIGQDPRDLDARVLMFSCSVVIKGQPV